MWSEIPPAIPPIPIPGLQGHTEATIYFCGSNVHYKWYDGLPQLLIEGNGYITLPVDQDFVRVFREGGILPSPSRNRKNPFMRSSVLSFWLHTGHALRHAVRSARSVTISVRLLPWMSSVSARHLPPWMLRKTSGWRQTTT